jgi:predicted ribosome quality control (RQC) complex YloA/Tae2 family protein
MAFDVLATAAMADELKMALGGRVQEVVIPEPLALGLELFALGARRYLYATVRPDEARIQFVEAKLRRGTDAPTPLLLLLRKYIQDGRLIAVEQPGFERLLRLGFEGDHGPVYLYFEIMGRHSNIILVDAEYTILDSLKRIPARLSRRTVLPHQPYTPPPPQAKASLTALTPAHLAAELARLPAEDPLWRKLVNTIAGLSPLSAREVVYRVAGDAQAERADPAALLATIAELMGLAKTSAWQPCLALANGHPAAFAPYPLTHYAERETLPTFSQAMTRYYADRPAAAERAISDGYAGAREVLRQIIAAGREKLQKQADSLRRSMIEEEERNALMQKGQLILAYGYEIAPGQKELVVDMGDGQPVRIALDTRQSPSENAQHYFREYEKRKAAAEGGPARLRAVELKLGYLDQLETDLMLAVNRPEIEQVHAALMEAGYTQSASRTPQPRSVPAQYRSEDGFLILVGKNSLQNDALTFGRAKGHDLWLHARGIPGSHVIVVTDGRQAPERTILYAAQLAAYYSKSRNDLRVEVDYTLQKNVRRIPGADPGMTTYRGEKTLRVPPWAGK